MDRFIRLAVSLVLAAVVVGPVAYVVFDTGTQIVADRAAGNARIAGAGGTEAQLPVAGTIAVTRAAPVPLPMPEMPAPGEAVLEDPSPSAVPEFTNDHALRYESSPRQRATLAELRRTCVYWTGKVKAGTATAGEIEHQRAACRRMHEFARQVGLEAPEIALAAPARGEPDRVTSRVKVKYSTCGEYAYGSIDYRRCRAEQKKILDRKCKDTRERARRAGGSPDYPRLNDLAEAWCVAHFNYDIVR